MSVRSGPRLGSPFIPCPLLIAGCVLPEDHGDEAHIPVRQESGFSASFPTAVGHTHWDWSSSNPALPLRGLTRERLSALDAGPHVASSACYCPPNPFGRRSADRFTRLLPAGSGLSRQDQTNLCHGAHEVGGQPLGSKGIQPPPPEPDRHVFVHPALQTQDLHFRSASSLSRAE